MNRPKGTQSLCVIGAGPTDQVIKAVPGRLYSLNVTWTGGAADEMVHIHDQAAGPSDMTKVIATIRLTGAAGFIGLVLPSVGKDAVNGLFLNVQTGGGKYNIDIGYD